MNLSNVFLGALIVALFGAIGLGYESLMRKQWLGLPLTETEKATLNLITASNKEAQERQIKVYDDQIRYWEEQKQKLLNTKND